MIAESNPPGDFQRAAKSKATARGWEIGLRLDESSLDSNLGPMIGGLELARESGEGEIGGQPEERPFDFHAKEHRGPRIEEAKRPLKPQPFHSRETTA